MANKELPSIVIGFSTAASIYSGYTVIGVPAEAYTKGIIFIYWSVAVGLANFYILIFAPRMI